MAYGIEPTDEQIMARIAARQAAAARAPAPIPVPAPVAVPQQTLFSAIGASPPAAAPAPAPAPAAPPVDPDVMAGIAFIARNNPYLAIQMAQQNGIPNFDINQYAPEGLKFIQDPSMGDPGYGQWGTDPVDPHKAWTDQRGLTELGNRVAAGTTTPQDIAWMGQIASVGPEAGAQAMWNDTVARIQDREAGGGLFGIDGLDLGPLNSVAESLALPFVGVPVSGQTGYAAATGGDVGQAALRDAATVGAAAGGAYLAGPAAGGAQAASAADAAGGLMPEFGTQAAYQAGLQGATQAAPAAAGPAVAGTGQTLENYLGQAAPPVQVAGETSSAAGMFPPPNAGSSVLPTLDTSSMVDALNAGASPVTMGVPQGADPFVDSMIGGAGNTLGSTLPTLPGTPPTPAPGTTPPPPGGPTLTQVGAGAAVAATPSIIDQGASVPDPNADPNTNTNTNITNPQGPTTQDPLITPGSSPDVAPGDVSPTPTPTGTPGSSNVWNRIMDGTATAGDWASIAGNLAPGLLGYYGATRAADQYSNLAHEYMNMGAPYRQRLSDLYTPEGINNYMNSPEVQAPLQQGADAVARSLSTTVGNPAGNPSAMQKMLNYSANTLMGNLGNERNRLANFGGLSSFNAAAPSASTGAIGASAGGLNALGGSIADVLNPRMRLEDILGRLGGSRQSGSGLT